MVPESPDPLLRRDILTNPIDVGTLKGGRGNTKTSLNPSTHLEVAEPERAFLVYVHEKEGIALGVLMQSLGTEPQSVTHLSRRLNPTS